MQTNIEIDMNFESEFRRLTDYPPMRWQRRLFKCFFENDLPMICDLPTGIGKTSVMAVWYLARRAGGRLPRRLVYVVDRRAVVDQASSVADKIKERSGDGKLRVSTLRGQHADKGEWLEDPTAPAIIVGTVDMIGSRLLFSGYGVSRKMRPYHAGLLGVDTLVVLDESHLVPPFERLLDAVEAKTDLWPRTELHRAIVLPFKLLSLSATGHERGAKVFRLDEKKKDLDDDVVKGRLGAKKRLRIEPTKGVTLAETLGRQAWELCGNGKEAVRILVYSDSREVAEKTKRALEDTAKGDRKNRIPPSDIHEPELFVGARRVKERSDAEQKLRSLGFLAGSDIKLDRPAFIVATSAGEVGVDLDADHMVCDLVPWERMVQRLGRVNRLGKGDAQVVIVHQGEPQPKKPGAPTQKEIRAMIAWRTLSILDSLPNGSRIDVSPGAIRELKARAQTDTKLQEKISAATTPLPLYPALTRALVDAWSMTTLKKHTGRPGIAAWLRGWVEEEAQTAIVWRKYLPIRIEGGSATKNEVEEFFEAAPPHLSEKLETESWRIGDWLIERAVEWKERVPAERTIVAFVLDPDGALRHSYKVDELVAIRKDKDREKGLICELADATLIVDARLGGLSDGLLNEDADATGIRTADDGGEWPVDVGFQIRIAKAEETTEGLWRVAYEFATRRSAEGEALERLLIVTDKTEESRAESRHAQLLHEHQSWAERCARRIAQEAGLTGDYAEALAVAARLHDEGKKAWRWQLAFNAPKDGVYAKTQGPFVSARLGGYRHEFGSLPHAERDEGFKNLPADLQDLVLHLIAAHHGRARPVIEIEGCEDAPPSLLESRARDAALRFARLQKRWGPWGLAWWEALLRAADQQASKENDERGNAHGDL
jgi:CRISPR-associated endonuclease/helicase Cas3